MNWQPIATLVILILTGIAILIVVLTAPPIDKVPVESPPFVVVPEQCDILTIHLCEELDDLGLVIDHACGEARPHFSECQQGCERLAEGQPVCTWLDTDPTYREACLPYFSECVCSVNQPNLCQTAAEAKALVAGCVGDECVVACTTWYERSGSVDPLCDFFVRNVRDADARTCYEALGCAPPPPAPPIGTRLLVSSDLWYTNPRGTTQVGLASDAFLTQVEGPTVVTEAGTPVEFVFGAYGQMVAGGGLTGSHLPNILGVATSHLFVRDNPSYARTLTLNPAVVFRDGETTRVLGAVPKPYQLPELGGYEVRVASDPTPYLTQLLGFFIQGGELSLVLNNITIPVYNNEQVLVTLTYTGQVVTRELSETTLASLRQFLERYVEGADGLTKVDRLFQR